MELKSSRVANAIILQPAGRIDQDHADDFRLALNPYLAQCAAGMPPIILDFSAVSYISSVGLRALMLAARQAKSQGGRLVIAALTPIVKEVFEISRFNLVFQVFPDVDAALAALAEPA